MPHKADNLAMGSATSPQPLNGATAADSDVDATVRW